MKNNFIYAYRNIKKNAINSTITVFGLSLAIACCLIIYIYVNQEYNYNNFHKNADRIYRINYSVKYIEGGNKDVRVEPELIDVLKKEIPQIEKCAEYRFAFTNILSYNNNFFDVEVGCASEDFFDMFSFEFIVGNQYSIFTNPNEIVVTQKVADKLLGDNKDYKNLLGKAIQFPLSFGSTLFNIVGVVKDIPKNSSINFEVMVSGKSGRNFGGCDNGFGYTSVFYMVKDNATAKVAETNVNRVVTNYYKERVESDKKQNMLSNSNDAFVPFVLSLNDVYHEGDIENCFEKSVAKNNFTILITIGILILLIACSNYAILSLGQFINKIGDIGIRKSMGATTGNLFAVFLAEGIILTFLTFVVGGFLCSVSIPVFGKLAQTEIYTQLIDYKSIAICVIILFSALAVFTGIIPVLVFSKVKPHQMTGKKISIGNKNKLSQVFVSFQYSLSIILIIVTLFIVRQSNYLKNHDLGFDSNNMIDIETGRIDGDQKKLYKQMIAKHPGVLGLTQTARNFDDGSSNNYIDKGDGEQILVYRLEVDPDYISTLSLKLVQGKNFTESNATPSDKSMIVNEKFVEMFGIEDNPIGKSYRYGGVNFTIIGVVADYHFANMRNRIQPVVHYTRTGYGNSYNHLLLRYHPKQLADVMKHIEKSYKNVAPGKSFTYKFWNDLLKQRYQEEERWSKIIGIAAIIAIIISSLGLFGLTILLINQRIKEIGVRKVNGATTTEILFTINKSFIGWLLGSLIISFPIAYYLVNKGLEDFTNKIEVSWWVFIIAGAIAFMVALLTVSWQSWRAARRNPVDALRYE